MRHSTDFEFDDLQALFRFGHGKLTDTCFMLLDVADAAVAKQWLAKAPVSSAAAKSPPPDTALQIAFSAEGLRALGLKASVIEGFSDEFITGMAGDESRSRRLGDVGSNTPERWDWGGEPGRVPHATSRVSRRRRPRRSMSSVADRDEAPKVVIPPPPPRSPDGSTCPCPDRRT